MPRLINSASAMTKVPSFHAKGSTGSYGATSPVPFDTVEFDNMGGYDTTNMRYYAQLSGKYLITVKMGILRYQNSENGYPRLVKNASTHIYYAYFGQGNTGDSSSMYQSMCMSIIVELAYGDYVWVQFNPNNADYYRDAQELRFCGQYIGPLE